MVLTLIFWTHPPSNIISLILFPVSPGYDTVTFTPPAILKMKNLED
jgi:hypothetical protein